MEQLRAYLNNLDVNQQQSFADRCGTTLGYLRKVLSTKQDVGPEIVIAIERETGGQVTCEQLRPDIDWAVVRGTRGKRQLRKTG